MPNLPTPLYAVWAYLGVSVPITGIGLVAVATTLFTAIATFAALTGGGALVLAAWHLRHCGEASRQTTRMPTCHSPPGCPGP